ncbi:MAG TPA: GntR family transcriptional regulator [Planctomicrobium sp.]|nr:GntR family transcriptional regulator [Planctomicrobium sp.]
MDSSSQLDQAYTYIRERIEGGIIRPGQRLSRRKLAEEIGVSPAMVLKALAQLERDGVTETRPRSGTYVRELSVAEYEDLCDLREMLEPYAAARAAERISKEDLKVLQESCERHYQYSTMFPVPQNVTTAWLRHCQIDHEECLFHGTILKASGNKLLTQLTQTLRLLSHVSPQLVYSDGHGRENDITIVASEHTGIVEAIATGNSDLAYKRMLNHLRGARVILQQHSETAKPSGRRSQLQKKR